MTDRAPDSETRYERLEADLDAATSARFGKAAGRPVAGAPSEESLLRLRRDPGGMPAEERAEIERWFAANPAERDAFEAFRSLAAMPKPESSISASSLGWLSRLAGVLAPLARAPALSAALIVLVAGVSLWQNPFDAGDPRFRGDAEIEASWTLTTGTPLRIQRAELPAEGSVTLALELPRGALLRSPVASIQQQGPTAPPPEVLAALMGDDGRAIVTVPVHALRAGEYRIEIRPSGNAAAIASYGISVD